MTNMMVVECPMCRLRTPKGEVSYVVANKTNEREEKKKDIKLNGTYSAKVEGVLTELLHLQSEDPDVKVIIFSTVSSRQQGLFIFYVTVIPINRKFSNTVGMVTSGFRKARVATEVRLSSVYLQFVLFLIVIVGKGPRRDFGCSE